MPRGQANTIWFPELKDILKHKWNSDLSIKEQFDLVNNLNVKLKQIRLKFNVQPVMMWCPECQKLHFSKLTNVSITAMYYSLKRFGFCERDEFNKLLREWKKYSKSENIDIYGCVKIDKDIEVEKD